MLPASLRGRVIMWEVVYMKDFSGIEFASEHNGTDVFRVIELAYEQGRKDGHSEQLGTNLAEVGTDLISRQAAIDDIWTVSPLAPLTREWIDRWLRQLPSAESESFEWCTDCKEYDQEKHCCPRWNKVIKNTLVEVERERRVTT